jgi:hypothetical protein
MQKVKIDWNFDEDPPEVFCPFCKSPILPHGEEPAEYCAHVQYIYMSAIGEFTYKNGQISNLVGELEASVGDEFDLDDWEILEKLESKEESGTEFGFELALSGMSCGPVSHTFHIGMDLSAPDDQA